MSGEKIFAGLLIVPAVPRPGTGPSFADFSQLGVIELGARMPGNGGGDGRGFVFLAGR